MFKLLLFLYTIKLYARNNILKRIKKKHEQDVLSQVRSLDNLKTKYMKVQTDIKFIKICKQENLIPIFANVKLPLKHNNNKLKKRIARIVMETEIQNKHREKKSFKKEIRQKCILLKSTLGIVVFNALLHHLNNVIKRKHTAILLRHHKKLEKCRYRQNKHTSDNQNNFESCIVRNFSSYSLSQAEINALSFGLDQHIPTNINRNSIQTEFDSFYQRLVIGMPNIPENELQQVKTKLRNICERYRNIKVQYKQRQISKGLSQREDTTIMKADKVRGVVIMNKSKYLEKCLTLLNSEQFVRLN